MLLLPYNDYTRIYINCRGLFFVVVVRFFFTSIKRCRQLFRSEEPSDLHWTNTHIHTHREKERAREKVRTDLAFKSMPGYYHFIKSVYSSVHLLYIVHSQILIGSSKAPLWTFPTESGCIISLNKLYHLNGAKMVGWSSNEWLTSFIGFWVFRAKVRTLFWCRNSHSICILKHTYTGKPPRGFTPKHLATLILLSYTIRIYIQKKWHG